jgi:hypothetical protein
MAGEGGGGEAKASVRNKSRSSRTSPRERIRLVTLPSPCERAVSYGVLADLADFIADHRPHGSLTADATEPAWNGYLLTLACRVEWCLSGG